MCVVHSRADLPKQVDSLANGEVPFSNPLRNGFAIDVFHGKIRDAVLGTAVKKTRNVGMFKTRQDLTFVPEAFAKPINIAPVRRYLQRDLFVVFCIVAACFEDQAHAAAPDFPNDTVGSEAPPDPIIRSDGGSHGGSKGPLRNPLYGARNLLLGLVGVQQHGSQFAPQIRILRSGTFDEIFPIIAMQIESGVEHFLQAAPAFRGELKA